MKTGQNDATSQCFLQKKDLKKGKKGMRNCETTKQCAPAINIISRFKLPSDCLQESCYEKLKSGGGNKVVAANTPSPSHLSSFV